MGSVPWAVRHSRALASSAASSSFSLLSTAAAISASFFLTDSVLLAYVLNTPTSEREDGVVQRIQSTA